MEKDNILLVFKDNYLIEYPLKEGEGKQIPLKIEGEKVCTYECSLAKRELHLLDVVLKPSRSVEISSYHFLWLLNEKRAYLLPNASSFSIGKHSMSTIEISSFREEIEFSIGSMNEQVVYVGKGHVYKNGKRITTTTNYQEGDCFYSSGYKFTIQSGRVIVEGDFHDFKTDLNELDFEETLPKDLSEYKRSPRIIKSIPEDKITLVPPSILEDGEKESLIKRILPPLLMLGLTIGIMIIQPRGIYALIGIVSTSMSIIMSVTGYFSDKKAKKEKKIITEKLYNDYLLQKSKELNKLKKEQWEAVTYNYPSLEEIGNLIVESSSRLYERNSYDDDFLTVSIGTATLPSSYSVASPTKELNASVSDLMIESERLYEDFSKVENLPVTVNLSRAHIGLVGEKKYVHLQLVSLFLQLTFFHSYHDIEFVFLYEEQYKEQFAWLRWFPHFKINAINVTGLVDRDNVGDQVLNSLNQILKQRKVNLEEDKKISQFLPHYIFVVDAPRLVLEHSIMEFLQHNEKLGFSLVYTSDSRASLPENIKTIVVVGDAEKGMLEMNEGCLTRQLLDFQRLPNIELEFLSRKLAAVTHIKGISTQIPSSITFFEMYQIQHPQELNLLQRWKTNNSHKTLAVPLGVRGKEDYVYLNLHEKAHGPHGLVAGTTGSGKSEIVQSYILSLAVNFHPYEVGFLLIDYKGGGMAALFKNLPHLLGMITNLDGSESMRAMASIKSELSRRQMLFSEHDVNHINQYNQLYKSGEASKPLPHLFLISDEFAELKKEQPEFMSELVSTARIGRSLGIHLILATQKPTGVVDDQIWSNSKFKLALKVQNKADSNEILKTPDAANITLPGRAYLQVGNNEIYELFQSAWSGAPYADVQIDADFDERIYEINSLGQRSLLGKDLSGKEEKQTRVTQLDAVVEHINETFQQTGLPVVERPWHPPLSQQLTSPHFNEIIDVSEIKTLNTKIAIGIVDIPEEQMQREFVYDLKEDGNIAIFGSSTSGKSVTITTILMSAAVKNSPKLLQYYIFDFGNANLVPLKALPHTADYVSIDDEDKFRKIIKILDEEIAIRKGKLASKNAINFSMYNQLSEEKIPATMVVIDNFDAMREMDPELTDFFAKYSRDGLSLGLYLIISASRTSAVKFNMINNFRMKIAHYLMDKSDYHTLVGRPAYELTEVPGRAFVKLSNTNMMQVYTVVPHESDMEYIALLGEKISELVASNSGTKAEGVRMLPNILTMPMLLEASDKSEKSVSIGLDRENVEPVYLDLSQDKQVILGGPQSGKTSLLKIMLQQLEGSSVFLFDSKAMELHSYRSSKGVKYASGDTDFEEVVNQLEELVTKRKELYEQSDKSQIPKVFYSLLDQVYVFVDDIDYFAENVKIAKKEKIIISAKDTDIHFIGTTLSSRLRGFDEITKLFKEALYGVILGHPNEQMLWNIDGMRKYKPMPDGALVYVKGKTTEIKVPRI